MKIKLLILSFLISAVAFGQVYQSPIYITKGGTYTGNYRSDDPSTPAILILCYDSVTITGCNILSAGEGIKAYGGSRLNIHHNNIRGLLPTNGTQYGRALNDYQPQTLTFENNVVEHTGGLMVDHSNENTKSAVIRYNLIRNTDRRGSDGQPKELRASILFNTPTIYGEIAWNKFENVLDSSYVEDNINCGNIVASKANPLNIHDNFIFGAYPTSNMTSGYTGSGITIEGAPSVNTMATVSQWVNIYNNQIISTGNAGININAGHDIHSYKNTIISSGMLPNGTKSLIFWGAKAIWPGSGYGAPVFSNITSDGDTVGYVRADRNAPLPGRQDYVLVDGSPINVDYAKDYHLPNPITLATELAEIPKWEAKLKANGITIGNNPNNPIPVPVIIANSVQVGKTITGTINPVDSAGRTVTYQLGSVKVVGDDLVQIVKDGELSFKLTGVTSGTSTMTVSLITNNGNTVTETVTVKVLPLLDEVKKLIITLK